jgi:hypothetical protein
MKKNFVLFILILFILSACGVSIGTNTILNINDEEYTKFFEDFGREHDENISDYKIILNEINLIPSKTNGNKNYNKLLVDYEKFGLGDILWNNDLIYFDDNGATVHRTELLQNYTDEPLNYYDSYKEIIEKFNNLSGTELCIDLLNHRKKIEFYSILSGNSVIWFFRDFFPSKKNEIIEEIKSKGYGPERETKKINEELERLEILYHKALVKVLYNYATLREYQYLRGIYEQNYFSVLPDNYWGDTDFPSRARLKQQDFLIRFQSNQLNSDEIEMVHGFCEANHQFNFRLTDSYFADN